MRTKAVLLVLVASMAAAGCSSSTAAAPSKASYDKKVNGICSVYNAKVSDALKGITNSTPVSTAVSDLSKAIAYAKKDVRKLEAQPRPSGESAQLQQAFDTLNQGIPVIERFRQALQSGDAAKVTAAESQLNALNPKVNQQFDALGLKICGSDSGSST